MCAQSCGKLLKPIWPRFLIYKTKGYEKIPRDDKTMAGRVGEDKAFIWRPEGLIVWLGLYPLNQLNLERQVILGS